MTVAVHGSTLDAPAANSAVWLLRNPEKWQFSWNHIDYPLMPTDALRDRVSALQDEVSALRKLAFGSANAATPGEPSRVENEGAAVKMEALCSFLNEVLASRDRE